MAVTSTTSPAIQPHNEKPSAVWSSGGKDYDQISRGIADSIEHCVLRLNPQPGERILDLATGTGWTSRVIAQRGATVVGCDIATDLLEAARASAAAAKLPIDLPDRRRRKPAVRRRVVRCRRPRRSGSCSPPGRRLRRRSWRASCAKAAGSR